MYLERYKLDGRTAFITGGGRGIGLASAEAMAECGARIVLSDHNSQVLEEGTSYLKSKGYNVSSYVLDVTKSDEVKKLAAQVEREVGPVDILFANAGIAWPDTGAEDMSDEIWTKVIDVNLNGVFWCCREFGARMLERKRGSIVATGSLSGLISNKPQRQAHYNASKAAVHHLTRCLAAEWAPSGVRVNAVAPGYIDTPMSGGGLRTPEIGPFWLSMTPMNRAGTADEIASVVLFLASDASSLLTGSVVVADAGYSIW
ncbi:NAD(P)-dependent dehydrogenase (short-subunit alcohol dehydrogenase family) [Herbaspirillum sp. 1173]|uniref:SDR family NAD(P)-dependent oxidoreductase n=1 Tax=Herbaspirillum sp. 1173 TaxID=2817734 RepID=UPI002866C2B6|nr:SDR family oxidoreductase [Herbaspirillum sp. 1173]MDR6743319.1 NAD(P)-dependent dehydrogenase (short-subunit alcohol dehydrogenase family) [Herbaspirillum sp. 1173]